MELVTTASTLPSCQHKNMDYIVACSYRFALEWAPYDSTVTNREFSQSTAGQNATLGDVEGVHNCDDEVVSRTCALDIFQELGGDKLVHVAAEVRRVQRHMTRQIVEEEHVGPVIRLLQKIIVLWYLGPGDGVASPLPIPASWILCNTTDGVAAAISMSRKLKKERSRCAGA